ncbi:MAG: ATP-binding protein [Polyangiaceae bacterium]
MGGANDERVRSRERKRVLLDQLPVAAVATLDGVFVAVNPAFIELTGWQEPDLVGQTIGELMEKLVPARDRAVIGKLHGARNDPGRATQGWLWCRTCTKSGGEVPVRVEWRFDPETREALIFLLDARPEMFGQEVSEGLARVAGALSRCSTEQEVLDQAVDALCERGFTATALVIEEGDPLLRYAASRTPGRPGSVRILTLPRPPRDVLERVNPAYKDRRAAFFQDGMRLVREAYTEPVAAEIIALLPAEKMVQAPLFLAEQPYGALIVTSDALTPIVATAIDLFAELVGKALETVRLRKERVERERLAALGEAAAVMAHEVRNPVGSIMNALTLLERQAATPEQRPLLAIISEETQRLEQLVTQLLDFGRPLFPRPRSYPLEELTRRAVRALVGRGELSESTLVLPETVETMGWMDPDLAELALVNVLRNARQSIDANGRVRLTIEDANDVVRWIAEDDGRGIPDEVVRLLGQPFVTTRATGTGMGLAVVQRILEASRGKLAISRAVSGGARIVLEFPKAAPSD